MKLVEFLLARIAEDEGAARAAASNSRISGYAISSSPPVASYSHPPNGEAIFRWRSAGYIGGTGTHWVEEDGGSQHLIRTYSTGLADYCVQFQPQRVLAECEAKRHIVELYAEHADYDDVENSYEHATGRIVGLGEALRLLALPYSTHPDYDESWRP